MRPKLASVTQLIIALAAVGALTVSIYNAMQINEVHVTFNSKMSEYIELVKKASKAEGVKQEKDRDKVPD